MKKAIARRSRPTAVSHIPRLVGRIFEVVRELEARFRGRHFTLDGHLLGSIGEVLAAHDYGLKLSPASSLSHDAVTRGGRRVQIKVTQTRRVSLSSEPQHLIVMHLDEAGRHHEIYNGPGRLVWRHVGKRAKNGQCSISTAALVRLQKSVDPAKRIARRRGTTASRTRRRGA